MTTVVPIFRVTQNRLKQWGVVIGKILKIGDKIFQSQFSEESVKKEDIKDIKSNETTNVSNNVQYTPVGSIVVYNWVYK